MAETSADEAAILEVIHRNRIALWTQDFELYRTCFVEAPHLTRWGWWKPGGTFVRHGWDEISARVLEQFKDKSLFVPAFAHDAKVENLRIRVGADMAWATFDQVYPHRVFEGHTGPGLTREVRFFEKHNGKWLIAFLGFLDNDAATADSISIRLADDGTVIWTSPAATKIIEAGDDIVIRNGRLRIRDSRTDARLQAAIRWAALLDTGVMSTRGAMPIVLEAGDGLPSRVWWVIRDGGMILFSLADRGLSESRLNVAAAVYGLSPAQRRLTQLVSEGLSLTEIATRMGIAANTARTHLQRVFDKTGVRTQPALVRVLLTAAAPM